VSLDPSHKSVREIVVRAVSEPAAVVAGFGAPARAEVQRLYSSPELTILNVIWGPRMTIMPHNHLMWAVIGIYTGREDNIFWRRLPDEDGGRIEAAGAKSLGERDVEPLGRDIIHTVTNPLPRFTGAIHVYGGDFLPFPAANGIRKHCSNNGSTWRKTCGCSNRRTRIKFRFDQTPDAGPHGQISLAPPGSLTHCTRCNP
jgi:predicted metal-dependent enzyme (double-stranded beta helix superfamily)